MGIREIMARARRAQIEHDKRIPVQLEIPEYADPFQDMAPNGPNGFALWASDEERMAKFREETRAAQDRG